MGTPISDCMLMMKSMFEETKATKAMKSNQKKEASKCGAAEEDDEEEED